MSPKVNQAMMERTRRFRRRTRRSSSHRRGATMVEMAIILLVFLMLVFGMLDLGLGVYRYNELAQASREVAREVVVHGEYADKLGPWGPDKFGPMNVQAMIDNTNSDADLEEMETEIVKFLGPFTAFFDQSKVNVTIEWPNSSNFYGEPVEVTVAGPYEPFLPSLIGLSTISLQAKTTMKIAH